MPQNNRRFAGQTAPLGSDGIGRQVLYRCGECQRIWLQDARSAILDLQPAQVQQLVTRLQADLARLPEASCRFCRFKRGTGAFEVDEYAGGKGGYGLSWEMPQPIVTHLLCTILSEQ